MDHHGDAVSRTPIAYVLDDDEDAVAVTAGMVRACGWIAVEFRDPLVCLGHIGDRIEAEVPPDAVVTDICMADLDGLALVRILRRTLGGEHIPVVGVSGIMPADGVIAAELAQLGVPMLVKPLRLDVLRAALGKLRPPRP